MVVSAVGVFAGNSGGSAPAHTALFDYAFSTTSPVVQEDGFPTCYNLLSLSTAGDGTVAATPNGLFFGCDELVSVQATPGPGQMFAGWSGDVTGIENPLLLTMTGNVDLVANFIPTPTPPVISSVQVALGVDQATVSWYTNEPATSRVDSGPTAAYENGFVEDTALETFHVIELNGLAADSTIHYQVTSTNIDLLSASTGDLTFTTLPLGSDPSGIISDDFRNGVAGSQWTFVDPLGDATLAFAGAGTANANAQISVPGGVAHQPWTGGNTAPRLMQPVNDGDFEFEVKFESMLATTYQMQGIIVEESPGNYLRFEYYGDASQLYLFAASALNDNVAVQLSQISAEDPALHWLRVQRVGDLWTVWTSSDGVNFVAGGNFSYAMAVSSVGVFAGNAGVSSPAHTGVIDYAFSTQSPLAPEDGFEPCNHVLTTSAAGNGSVAVSPDDPTYDCDAAVSILASPGPGQVFTGWSGDASGSANPLLLTMTGNFAIVANFAPAPAPPVISNIQATPGITNATVTWQTDESATSRVDYGVAPGPLDTMQEVTDLVTFHAIQLTGLVAETSYVFTVSSEDVDLLTSTSSEAGFTTLPVGSDPAGIDSDDFSRNNLDTGTWSFSDSGGASKLRITGVGSSDALLELELEPGIAQQAVTGADDAPRVSQSVNNADFGLEVKFESLPSLDGQRQGLIIEGSGSRLRFDVHHDGAGARVAAASVSGGTETIRIDVPVVLSAPVFLAVERTANTWRLLYSGDGTAWIEAGSFDETLIVGSVSLFGANVPSSGAAPGFTVLVDYLQSDAGPIASEDASVAADTLAPLIHGITTTATADSVELGWSTDEASDSTVLYGVTTSYEMGSVDSAALVQDHTINVIGLLPDTVYHFAVVSEDGLGQSTTSANLPVLTDLPPVGEGPIIDLFYGSIQSFGSLGTPQPWANVLGNVSDPDGVATLTYELNGQAPRSLSMGPDFRRLTDPGDFNADISIFEFVQGTNTVLLRAVDTLGNESTRTVLVNYSSGSEWPKPYFIDWSTVTRISDVAQVVDGDWVVENGLLKNQHLGYDRLVGLGDLAWEEYEVEVPVTVYGIDPEGFSSPSATPLMGIILRWNGHTQRSSEQPFIEFDPVGAMAHVQFSLGGGTRLAIYAGANTYNNTVPDLVYGVTYIMKFRVEQIVGVGGLFRYKVWEQGTPEPPIWHVEKQEPLSAPQFGSALLVSHYTDTEFGNVTVTPLGNLSPVAVVDSYGTTEDTGFAVTAAQGVLANDSDPESDPLEARLLVDASFGSLALASDGSFTYTPDPEAFGTDSFTYEAFDGRSPSAETTVTIDVTAIEDPPLTNPDAYTTPEVTTLVVAAGIGVLANDFDPEGQPLSAQLDTDAQNGSLSLASDGSFTYTPNPGFAGNDSFTYTAWDGGLASPVTTATITVANPPSAAADAYGTDEDVDLVVDAATGVLANDNDPQGDPLTAELVASTSSGSLSLASDGSFSYSPAANFNGQDSFTYRATDGTSVSNTAIVDIDVAGLEDPPIAMADAYEVEPDGSLLVSTAFGVLANDVDPDGAPLSAILVDDVSEGTLTLLSDGGIIYFPNPGFTGTDSFTYQADDGTSLSAVAPVTITVAVTLSTGLVAHWPLDAGSGSVAGDVSGNGHDGALVDPIWTASTGDGSSAALDFDGVDDYVDVGSIDVAGQALTLAAWVNADDFDNQDQRILSKATGTGEQDHIWMLSTVNSGGFRLRARLEAGGSTVTIIAGEELTKDKWTHVALTYDGADTRLYQDGVEVASVAQTGDLGVDPATGVALGNQSLGAGQKAFDGYLDDIRIYDRTLSLAEVAALAGTTPPGPDLTPPAPPAEVVAVPLSETSAEVSWSDAVDNEAMGTYAVLRDGVEIASGLTLTQHVDTGLTGETPYDYTVVARDAAGNESAPSVADGVVTLGATTPVWFDSALAYRIPIDVDSNGTARVGRYMEATVDFTTALGSVAQSAALDTNSLRVVRSNVSGQVLDSDVAFQFDPAAGFDAATNATGELVVRMAGTAAAADARRYDLYFDVVGEGFTPIAVADRVTVSNVVDEGQTALRIDTGSNSYFFQEQGASLSSLVDGDGNDWIGYRVGGGPAGDYRGIPNLIHPESEFHPGGTAGSTTTLSQGPLRLRLKTSALANTWSATWAFYDDHVSMTVEQIDHAYWFLYEGAPGGLLETSYDFVTRSDGTQTLLGESWDQDLVGEEWVYFGDPDAQRSLFLASHEDDAIADSYRTLSSEMTVFGFGRSGNSRLLNSAPKTFSLGLIESIEFDVTARRIRSIMQDLGVTVGSIQEAP